MSANYNCACLGGLDIITTQLYTYIHTHVRSVPSNCEKCEELTENSSCSGEN